MSKGYIRLWRKSMDSGLIKNHNVWVFWTWCLMKANHKQNHKQLVGFQEIILQPGDFIFGRKKAAEETSLSEQNIRTCLAFLKRCKNLTIKSTNKFSIISIVNWNTYQFTENEPNQQPNQHVTSIQPAGNHKQEHINNLTKEPPPLPPKGEMSDFKSTAEKIYVTYVNLVHPTRKSKKRAIKNISTWLSRGRTDSDLVAAANNYKKTMSNDPQYRKDPANFYGLNEDCAFDFIPSNIEPIRLIQDMRTDEEIQEEIDKELAEKLS